MEKYDKEAVIKFVQQMIDLASNETFFMEAHKGDPSMICFYG
jgi:hypothetical protein